MDVECQMTATSTDQDICYYDSALAAARYAHEDQEQAISYLLTGLRLCNNIFRERVTSEGNYSRESCYISIAKSLAPILQEEVEVICSSLESVAKDKCYGTVAITYPKRQWSLALELCKHISSEATRKECIYVVNQENGFCDHSLGENCKVQPTDCPCTEGEICAPERNVTDEGGCASPVCGDRYCDSPFEHSETCCEDCGCPKEEICVPERNTTDEGGCASPVCGDRYCDSPFEHSETCCEDCGCPKDSVCSAAECVNETASPTPAPAPTITPSIPPEPTPEQFIHPSINQKGMPCMMNSECSSGICMDEICTFRADGEICEENVQCESFNCRNKICCSFGKECCELDVECGEDGVCDVSAHYCLIFPEGEKTLRMTMGFLGAAVFLMGSLIIAVLIALLVGVLSETVFKSTPAWMARGREAQKKPPSLMCDKCGKRVASRGSLCFRCAKDLHYMYGGKA